MDIQGQLAELKRVREILSQIDKLHDELRPLFRELFDLPDLDLRSELKHRLEVRKATLIDTRLNYMKAFAKYKGTINEIRQNDFAKE